MTPRSFNILCFRFHPVSLQDEKDLNSLNGKLLQRINNTGKAYLTHTKLQDKFVIRMVTGQTNVTLEHVLKTWELIVQESEGLRS